MKECMRTAKELAQQIFLQYISDFKALRMAARDEIEPQFRGIFSSKQTRRNLLIQFASLGHMVYLLPPNSPSGNKHHPRFDYIEKATLKVLSKLT